MFLAQSLGRVPVLNKAASVFTARTTFLQMEEQVAEAKREHSQASKLAARELRDAKEASRSELAVLQSRLRQVGLPFIIKGVAIGMTIKVHLSVWLWLCIQLLLGR